MASFEVDMLKSIRCGLDHHNSTCPLPAKAILLNPGNHALFGWEELWGLPVMADDRVPPKRFRIDCGGSAFGIEDELEQFIKTKTPVEPVFVPTAPSDQETIF